MRRRETEAPGFLERSAGWWRQRRPSLTPACFQLRALAGMMLAHLGELRSDELVRLQEIAAGNEEHPPIAPDAAQAILRRHLEVEVGG